MKRLLSTGSFLLITAFGFASIAAQSASSVPFTVTITGHGTRAIIFIPGFASSEAVWDDTKARYGSNFTCYTLNMAGFAGVKAQPDPSFKHWETAIAQYIREQKIARPILIGHSLGGCIALAIASDYPELIDKIVVVDALPCLQALMNPNFKSDSAIDCKNAVAQMVSASAEEFYKMQKMYIPRLVTDTAKQELVVGWSMRSDRATLGRMFCDFSNTDLRQSIKKIKCSVLVMLEANFKTIKPAVEAQYQNLKTADLRYADKGLHFMMYDDAAWYFQQLDSFLR